MKIRPISSFEIFLFIIIAYLVARLAILRGRLEVLANNGGQERALCARHIELLQDGLRVQTQNNILNQQRLTRSETARQRLADTLANANALIDNVSPNSLMCSDVPHSPAKQIEQYDIYKLILSDGRRMLAFQRMATGVSDFDLTRTELSIGASDQPLLSINSTASSIGIRMLRTMETRPTQRYAFDWLVSLRALCDMSSNQRRAFLQDVAAKARIGLIVLWSSDAGDEGGCAEERGDIIRSMVASSLSSFRSCAARAMALLPDTHMCFVREAYEQNATVRVAPRLPAAGTFIISPHGMSVSANATSDDDECVASEQLLLKVEGTLSILHTSVAHRCVLNEFHAAWSFNETYDTRNMELHRDFVQRPYYKPSASLRDKASMRPAVAFMPDDDDDEGMDVKVEPAGASGREEEPRLDEFVEARRKYGHKIRDVGMRGGAPYRRVHPHNHEPPSLDTTKLGPPRPRTFMIGAPLPPIVDDSETIDTIEVNELEHARAASTAEEPSVCVITVTRDRERLLQNTIFQIFDQHYDGSIEHIVVDDSEACGSIDVHSETAVRARPALVNATETEHQNVSLPTQYAHFVNSSLSERLAVLFEFTGSRIDAYEGSTGFRVYSFERRPFVPSRLERIRILCRISVNESLVNNTVIARLPMSIGKKRNVGVEYCSSRIVSMWDDDDIYSSERLSWQVAPIKSGEADICTLRHQWLLEVDVNGRTDVTKVRDVEEADWGGSFGTLVFWRDVHGDSDAARSTEIDAVFPDASIGEDLSFVSRALGLQTSTRFGRPLYHKVMDNDPAVYVYVRWVFNTWAWNMSRFDSQVFRHHRWPRWLRRHQHVDAFVEQSRHYRENPAARTVEPTNMFSDPMMDWDLSLQIGLVKRMGPNYGYATDAPTQAPTTSPTAAPTPPTHSPTLSPTLAPTTSPTFAPTATVYESGVDACGFCPILPCRSMCAGIVDGVCSRFTVEASLCAVVGEERVCVSRDAAQALCEIIPGQGAEPFECGDGCVRDVIELADAQLNATCVVGASARAVAAVVCYTDLVLPYALVPPQRNCSVGEACNSLGQCEQVPPVDALACLRPQRVAAWSAHVGELCAAPQCGRPDPCALNAMNGNNGANTQLDFDATCVSSAFEQRCSPLNCTAIVAGRAGQRRCTKFASNVRYCGASSQCVSNRAECVQLEETLGEVAMPRTTLFSCNDTRCVQLDGGCVAGSDASTISIADHCHVNVSNSRCPRVKCWLATAMWADPLFSETNAYSLSRALDFAASVVTAGLGTPLLPGTENVTVDEFDHAVCLRYRRFAPSGYCTLDTYCAAEEDISWCTGFDVRSPVDTMVLATCPSPQCADPSRCAALTYASENNVADELCFTEQFNNRCPSLLDCSSLVMGFEGAQCMRYGLDLPVGYCDAHGKCIDRCDDIPGQFGVPVVDTNGTSVRCVSPGCVNELACAPGSFVSEWSEISSVCHEDSLTHGCDRDGVCGLDGACVEEGVGVECDVPANCTVHASHVCDVQLKLCCAEANCYGPCKSCDEGICRVLNGAACNPLAGSPHELPASPCHRCSFDGVCAPIDTAKVCGDDGDAAELLQCVSSESVYRQCVGGECIECDFDDGSTPVSTSIPYTLPEPPVRIFPGQCRDDDDCSGASNGRCVFDGGNAVGACHCRPGWGDLDCGEFTCAALNDCNADIGGGQCVGPNRCECNAGFRRPFCLPDCDVWSSCNGHGACVRPYVCRCEQGWAAPDCGADNNDGVLCRDDLQCQSDLCWAAAGSSLADVDGVCCSDDEFNHCAGSDECYTCAGGTCVPLSGTLCNVGDNTPPFECGLCEAGVCVAVDTECAVAGDNSTEAIHASNEALGCVRGSSDVFHCTEGKCSVCVMEIVPPKTTRAPRRPTTTAPADENALAQFFNENPSMYAVVSLVPLLLIVGLVACVCLMYRFRVRRRERANNDDVQLSALGDGPASSLPTTVFAYGETSLVKRPDGEDAGTNPDNRYQDLLLAPAPPVAYGDTTLVDSEASERTGTSEYGTVSIVRTDHYDAAAQRRSQMLEAGDGDSAYQSTQDIKRLRENAKAKNHGQSSGVYDAAAARRSQQVDSSVALSALDANYQSTQDLKRLREKVSGGGSVGGGEYQAPPSTTGTQSIGDLSSIYDTSASLVQPASAEALTYGTTSLVDASRESDRLGDVVGDGDTKRASKGYERVSDVKHSAYERFESGETPLAVSSLREAKTQRKRKRGRPHASVAYDQVPLSQDLSGYQFVPGLPTGDMVDGGLSMVPGGVPRLPPDEDGLFIDEIVDSDDEALIVEEMSSSSSHGSGVAARGAKTVDIGQLIARNKSARKQTPTFVADPGEDRGRLRRMESAKGWERSYSQTEEDLGKLLRTASMRSLSASQNSLRAESADEDAKARPTFGRKQSTLQLAAKLSSSESSATRSSSEDIALVEAPPVAPEPSAPRPPETPAPAAEPAKPKLPDAPAPAAEPRAPPLPASPASSPRVDTDSTKQSRRRRSPRRAEETRGKRRSMSVAVPPTSASVDTFSPSVDAMTTTTTIQPSAANTNYQYLSSVRDPDGGTRGAPVYLKTQVGGEVREVAKSMAWRGETQAPPSLVVPDADSVELREVKAYRRHSLKNAVQARKQRRK